MTTGKTIALTRQTFVGKVMSLLFSMLYRLVRDEVIKLGSLNLDFTWGYDQPRQHIKKQRHYFINKGLSSQSYGFSSSHVWNGELDYKNAEHQRIDAFELWYWRRLLRVP